MKITEIFNNKAKLGKPLISLEVFPPKSDTPVENLFEKLTEFKTLNPDFISVTYGAGGSQKGRTLEIASKIKNEYYMESMAHITCVGHTSSEIDSILTSLLNNNIHNVLALRGDPPAENPNFDFSKNEFKYAYEMITHVRNTFGSKFCIGAACYVEGHVDSTRLKNDIINLKNKVDAGVDFLVTQLFFDNRLYYDFVDKCLAIGINCPITAGIMPIFKAEQIKRITSLCGASIPAKLVVMMDKFGHNSEDMLKAGIDFAAEQIQDLVSNGICGIHLLSMNRPTSSARILEKVWY